MAKVVIYTKDNCPFCVMAKNLLANYQVAFEEIRIDLDDRKRDEMIALSNKRTVPQIFINDQAIGGYDDLTALARTKKLNDLLNSK
jgi:glutaredoxin 3